MNKPEEKLPFWESLKASSEPLVHRTLIAVTNLVGTRDALIGIGYPETAKLINTGIAELVRLYLEKEEQCG